MDAILLAKLCLGRRGKQTRRLTAVAAYEDLATEVRVTEFCESLARQLGPNCEVTKQMWLLGELRVPRLCGIAAEEAAAGDLIIVSLHHGDGLPPEVIDWIQSWLANKQRRAGVLLALLDPPERGISSSLQASLKDFAQRGRLEFLVQAEETTADLS